MTWFTLRSLTFQSLIQTYSAKTATNCEVIVVDGGSTDATSRLARRAGAKVISSPRGRGVQMNKGASQARGDILLFLHADSQLPHEWHEHVHRALSPTPSPDSLSHASPKPPPQQQRVYRGWGSFKTIQIDVRCCSLSFYAYILTIRTWYRVLNADGPNFFFYHR